MIELDLTAQPDPTLTTAPPAHRYRLPGLLLVAVLLLAAGGAAPVLPVLWRYLGAVPAPGGPEAPFQLAGGQVYTFAAVSETERVTTAWSLAEPPRELWRKRLPARPESDLGMTGLEARPAGDAVLLGDGTRTTVVDARTGATRWTSPTSIAPLPGGRVGVVQGHQFRDDTVYDQASGEPGMLYFSATGEPHTEPPLRTDVRGVDLATGRTLWTVSAAGSVNVDVVPGDEPAVLLLSSDRLRRIDGDTGKVEASVPLPPVDGAPPMSSVLVDDLLTVSYGVDGIATAEANYSVETLERSWSRPVPKIVLEPAGCGGLICSGDRRALDVLDPRTGEARWRAPADVDLWKYGGYVLEVDVESGLPMRLVDPGTGQTQVDLAGWRAEVIGEPGRPIVLRRSLDQGASAFGVVLSRRAAIQPLGLTGGPVSDCTSDESHVVCRTDGGLRIWAYQA
ncbi:outer membrane protein assembly factor BamB family protein [Paractinoplanes maris]|uniref:outer membrane protein assembly factor BamB family protein n=1 Tax=Paractinoplanes maris TaxID=1734446 RepID=UPI0020225E2F|nr:PQQ-binding-like beta-propeller repeat protein [Actinoplanes maris]